MNIQNFSNPTVLLNTFSNWITRDDEVLSDVVEFFTDTVVDAATPKNLAAKFKTKYPSGLSFQLADVDSFQLMTDEMAIYWLDANQSVLGTLAYPVDWDPTAEENDYIINTTAYSITGNEYDVYNLLAYLMDNVATNNCISTAIQLVKDGDVQSLSDLTVMLPGFGARITDSAKTYLGYMSNYTQNFSSPIGLLSFIRDTYMSANGASVDPDSGRIVFSGNTKFVIKSAFTLAWSSVIGSALQFVGAIALSSLNAVLGGMVAGVGLVVSSVSNLLSGKTEGKLNFRSLNRSYDATLMVVPNFVPSPNTYVRNHINDYGLITYSTPGALIHFAKNGTINPTYSMAAIPELDVVTPFSYDSSTSTHVRQPGVPSAFNISRGSGTNPRYRVSFDSPNNIFRFMECYGDSPATTNDTLVKAASGIAYFIYNIFGCMSSVEFTVPSGWWSNFKSGVSLAALKSATYIETIQYMNTIAGVLSVLASGVITTVTPTMIGQDKDQWAYDPNDSGSIDLDSLLSWSILSEIYDYVQVATSKHDTYAGLDDTLNTLQSNNGILCLDNFINLQAYYSNFFFTPPVTTAASIAGFIGAVVAGAAIAIAGTIMLKKAIQNVVIPRMNRKYDQINSRRAEMQTSEYLSTHTKEQQLADQASVLAASRKYNLFANILGLSTISYTTGWENGDGRSTLFNSASVQSDGANILQDTVDRVQANSKTTCDNSAIDNQIIYKAITGRNYF